MTIVFCLDRTFPYILHFIDHYKLYSWHLATKQEISIPIEVMLTAWSHQDIVV